MSTEPPVSLQALERFDHPRNYGPLDTCDGHARITGPCGDTMEFWLVVADGRIAKANFVTDGCGPSRAAGSMASELVAGKLVAEALRIEQRDVLDALGGLPKGSAHCGLLAANTLKAAVRDFLDGSTAVQQDSGRSSDSSRKTLPVLPPRHRQSTPPESSTEGDAR